MAEVPESLSGYLKARFGHPACSKQLVSLLESIPDEATVKKIVDDAVAEAVVETMVVLKEEIQNEILDLATRKSFVPEVKQPDQPVHPE